MRRLQIASLFLLAFFFYSLSAIANTQDELKKLQAAYPDSIKSITKDYVIWTDGTQMPIINGVPNKSVEEKSLSPALLDQIHDVHYPSGVLTTEQLANILDDPGRIRYQPFFKKMYGNSPEEVKKNLVTIYWLPKVFGQRYPLQVTTINGVDKKLIRVSAELQALPPRFYKYLSKPAGTFCWRTIANTTRLSPHSFGMTIDINTDYSNYWQWDLKKKKLPITENAQLIYHNQIPSEIITIFEKNGFIWGGKWHHYDTMHFEYRPELL